MPSIRIFSYLPNPRVWKATIAARLLGVELEVLGSTPKELGDWLWDVEPRPLEAHERGADSPYARSARRGFSATLYKTDAFLRAHPFGTVPAAFVGDEAVGVFESNSILRAVARMHSGTDGLYGANAQLASRIDSFLDADLVFAREAQEYLLALQNGSCSAEGYARMAAAAEFFFSGLEQALASSEQYLVGQTLSIADIAVICDLAQFRREQLMPRESQQPALSGAQWQASYPRLHTYFQRLVQVPELAEDLGSYLDDFEQRLARLNAKS
ncbi:MAG: glutathione S-transferase family protein [Pseudomonadales bacterium]